MVGLSSAETTTGNDGQHERADTCAYGRKHRLVGAQKENEQYQRNNYVYRT